MWVCVCVRDVHCIQCSTLNNEHWTTSNLANKFHYFIILSAEQKRKINIPWVCWKSAGILVQPSNAICIRTSPSALATFTSLQLLSIVSFVSARAHYHVMYLRLIHQHSCNNGHFSQQQSTHFTASSIPIICGAFVTRFALSSSCPARVLLTQSLSAHCFHLPLTNLRMVCVRVCGKRMCVGDKRRWKICSKCIKLISTIILRRSP